MQKNQVDALRCFLYLLVAWLLLFLTSLFFRRARFFGARPFLPPILAAVPAVLEKDLCGIVPGLLLGICCDCLFVSPLLPGVYTLTLTLSAFAAWVFSNKLFSNGLPCSLVVSLFSFLIVDIPIMLFLFLARSAASTDLLQTMGREILVSLPLILPVYFLDWKIAERFRY